MTRIAMICIVQNEKTSTYKYLLEAYQSFFAHKPKSIFTDMDNALTKAILENWADVYHLWCIVHIYRNLYKKHFFALTKIGLDRNKLCQKLA